MWLLPPDQDGEGQAGKGNEKWMSLFIGLLIIVDAQKEYYKQLAI